MDTNTKQSKNLGAWLSCIILILLGVLVGTGAISFQRGAGKATTKAERSEASYYKPRNQGFETSHPGELTLRRSPEVREYNGLRIALFTYKELYDSVTINIFGSASNAYMHHLGQYADANPDYELIGTDLLLSSDKSTYSMEAGHYTYWRKRPK